MKLFKTTKQEHCLIDANTPTALKQFTDAFYEYFINRSTYYKSIIILCIGTDRATGDSLGPLIGHKLKSIHYSNVHIYGTLDNPVHAKNLEETLSAIQNAHDRPYIIAIDACLGKMDHIGYISMGEGAIKPGAGVNKDLPPVGDLFITGIVNFSGFMDMIILQNTRLSLVMKMADIITFGIKSALWRYYRSDESFSHSMVASTLDGDELPKKNFYPIR